YTRPEPPSDPRWPVKTFRAERPHPASSTGRRRSGAPRSFDRRPPGPARLLQLRRWLTTDAEWGGAPDRPRRPRCGRAREVGRSHAIRPAYEAPRNTRLLALLECSNERGPTVGLCPAPRLNSRPSRSRAPSRSAAEARRSGRPQRPECHTRACRSSWSHLLGSSSKEQSVTPTAAVTSY